MTIFRRPAASLTEDQRVVEIRELHNLALQIFYRRREREWSQEELARRAGMTQAQIAKVEAGEANPTARTLVKLSIALDCSIADLWLREDDCIAPQSDVLLAAWREYAADFEGRAQIVYDLSGATERVVGHVHPRRAWPRPEGIPDYVERDRDNDALAVVA